MPSTNYDSVIRLAIGHFNDIQNAINSLKIVQNGGDYGSPKLWKIYNTSGEEVTGNIEVTSDAGTTGSLIPTAYLHDVILNSLQLKPDGTKVINGSSADVGAEDSGYFPVSLTLNNLDNGTWDNGTVPYKGIRLQKAVLSTSNTSHNGIDLYVGNTALGETAVTPSTTAVNGYYSIPVTFHGIVRFNPYGWVKNDLTSVDATNNVGKILQSIYSNYSLALTAQRSANNASISHAAQSDMSSIISNSGTDNETVQLYEYKTENSYTYGTTAYSSSIKVEHGYYPYDRTIRVDIDRAQYGTEYMDSVSFTYASDNSAVNGNIANATNITKDGSITGITAANRGANNNGAAPTYNAVSNSHNYVARIIANATETPTVTHRGFANIGDDAGTTNLNSWIDIKIQDAKLTLTGSKVATDPVVSTKQLSSYISDNSLNATEQAKLATIGVGATVAAAQSAVNNGDNFYYAPLNALAPATTGISVATVGTHVPGYLGFNGTSQDQVTATGATTDKNKEWIVGIKKGGAVLSGSIHITDNISDNDPTTMLLTSKPNLERKAFTCTVAGTGVPGVAQYFATSSTSDTTAIAESALVVGTTYYYDQYYTFTAETTDATVTVTEGYVKSSDHSGSISSSTYYMPIADFSYVEVSSEEHYIQVNRGGYIPSGRIDTMTSISGTPDYAAVAAQIQQSGTWNSSNSKYVFNISKAASGTNPGYISDSHGTVSGKLELSKLHVQQGSIEAGGTPSNTLWHTIDNSTSGSTYNGSSFASTTVRAVIGEQATGLVASGTSYDGRQYTHLLKLSKSGNLTINGFDMNPDVEGYAKTSDTVGHINGNTYTGKDMNIYILSGSDTYLNVLLGAGTVSPVLNPVTSGSNQTPMYGPSGDQHQSAKYSIDSHTNGANDTFVVVHTNDGYYDIKEGYYEDKHVNLPGQVAYIKSWESNSSDFTATRNFILGETTSGGDGYTPTEFSINNSDPTASRDVSDSTNADYTEAYSQTISLSSLQDKYVVGSAGSTTAQGAITIPETATGRDVDKYLLALFARMNGELIDGVDTAGINDIILTLPVAGL